jgi:hypothetical protein
LPVHLIKLAVGIAGIDDLRRWQLARAKQAPPLRHRTRNFPKRAEEIVAGGSIYWVITRMVLVRQRITDILAAEYADGSRCTDLVLDPVLVPVRPRAVKPFQGWRYLTDGDAPADDAAGAAFDAEALPEKMRRELAALALL